MMAAISAAENGGHVTLLEPNERLGKKLNITGKGRCNVTNNSSNEELLNNIPKNGKFLYSVFSRFSSADTMAFFEKLGVPLKTERGNRVFPVSDRAFDISAALERRLKALRVKLVRDRAEALEIYRGRSPHGGGGRAYGNATARITGAAAGYCGAGYPLCAAAGLEPAECGTDRI